MNILKTLLRIPHVNQSTDQLFKIPFTFLYHLYLRGMRSIRWATIAVAVILILSCFFPWVVIESKNIIISGVNAEGTNYGKPGYFNIILTTIVILLSFFPKLWAQRISLFVAAFNMGWTLRNFIILGTCEAGECPVKKPAFYLFLISSILLLVSILFQKIKVPHTKENAAA